MGFFGRLVLAMAVVFLATACAEVEDFEYVPSSEIQPGPGLVTGDGGEYIIYQR